MLLSATLSALLLAGSAKAFFRLPCDNPLIIERADPIISPGKVAGHTHTISGGSNFSPSATFAELRKSECSSCNAKADLSAYWTPQLYFAHKDGTFSSVKQNGGGLIYYLFRSHPTDKHKVQAFPDGLKMVAGNPMARTYDVKSLQAQAIGWNCLGGRDPSTGETRNPWLPRLNCPDGLRGEVRFPSCWDGTNKYKPDQSHMAYPIGGESGPCPKTHPTRIVTLFFEIMYHVDDWKTKWGDALDPKSPFVLAQGDPTGYGYHGDFQNGWDRKILQKAVDTCTNDSGRIEDCPLLELFDRAKDGSCRKTPDINEIVTGRLPSLPGCNPLTKKTPTKMATCPSLKIPAFFSKPRAYKGLVAPPGSQVTSNMPRVLPSSSGFTYRGCYTDSSSTRALPTQLSPSKKTASACLALAKSKGYAFAGLEYGGECWVGRRLGAGSKEVGYEECGTVCEGSGKQVCGGGQRLSVYKLAGAKSKAKRHSLIAESLFSELE